MKVVVLAPRGATAVDAIRATGDVETIGWAPSGSDVVVRRPAPWAAGLQRRLGSGIPVRILLRFLGADDATQFARAVASDPSAQRVLASADLVVAAEEDATYAAWRAARSSSRPRAVYGFAAARAILESGSEETS
ncbi:hypothetical protein KZC51_09255 [Microbacterium sp. SSW1-49]|uniref:Uncharacterized protein n=1 Tax=Microbacterium croceum TaxID=2851645 RepID=A0ABT0FE36_9MICO|nr:hypothetical protein [Microbacterium croceum]MCK2036324.1 hypothetical protein [Microbacterium croceum]